MRIHGSCLLLLAALARAAAGDEIAEELELARKQYAEEEETRPVDPHVDVLSSEPVVRAGP
ncbi:MAG: hypothetical protein ACF8XB_05920, partial [Planctomycetota bacterium JB042]